MNEQPIRHLRPYRCTRAYNRIRRAVKADRGSTCEACAQPLSLDQLCVHHILETRIYPEFAREPVNMLVLCRACHLSVTRADQFASSLLMHFYSALPVVVRQHHLPFLSKHASPMLVSAFQLGNVWFWNDRAVEDLTR